MSFDGWTLQEQNSSINPRHSFGDDRLNPLNPFHLLQKVATLRNDHGDKIQGADGFFVKAIKQCKLINEILNKMRKEDPTKSKMKPSG